MFSLNAFVFSCLAIAAAPANDPMIDANQAKVIACAEAERVGFEFPGSCAQEFSEPGAESATAYTFFGQNADGNCGISVIVDKSTGDASAQIDCA